ncbi:peptidoglycan-binding protein [Prosthecomicrobium sp. N25]|uniref:peptidoglycan-binding protein n=1 Tax=Prosthecomicrobium sp. N25 TaxID=3129254 RepID=UPI0030784A0C
MSLLLRAGATAAVFALCATAAFAQVPPPPPPSPAPNPLIAPAQVAWDALPPETRKAIQDDLVWTSTYQGTLDGTFGKGTFDAILAFELKARLKPDGVLEERERAALAQEADKLRKLVGWQVVTDGRTGVKLGLPVKAFDLPPAGQGRGTVWARKGGAFTLATDRIAELDLKTVFDQLKADQLGRKVTYSVLRPSFLVVAGEIGAAKKFYTRYGQAASGLVGYTYTYDKTVPDADRMAVAIANSFDPGASAAAPQPPVAGGGPTGPAAVPPEPAKPQSLAASGLVVAPGRVLTVARAADGCTAVTVRGRPARVARIDKEAGLALLDGEAPSAAAVPFRASAPGIADMLLVLAQTERASGGGLVVAPGEAVPAREGGRAAFRVMTPLQPGGVGATVVDRSGAVAGFVFAAAQETRRVAGIVPEASHEVVSAAVAAQFLAASGVPVSAAGGAGTKTAGEIATALKGAVVQVVCSR